MVRALSEAMGMVFVSFGVFCVYSIAGCGKVVTSSLAWTNHQASAAPTQKTVVEC